MAVLKDWISLRDVRVDEWRSGGEEHHVKAFWKKDKFRRKCPECEARYPKLSPAGSRDRQVYDVPLRKPLYIELDRKRFKCECGKHITPTHPDLYRGRMMSVELVRYIWKSYLRGRPYWEIAERVGLATSTVQSVFQERAEIMDKPLTPTSATVLSIDEIYFRDHGHLAVFVDPESREVVEVLQGMSTEAILPFLQKHRSRLEKQGKRLEAAVMDMAGHFRKAIRQAFPEARIVVDRFHVERKAYGAVHNVRREAAARADESGEDPAPGDGFRTEWKRRKSKLDDNWHTMSPAEKMSLSAELEPIPKMEAAYRARQRFSEILEMTDRGKADRALRQWEEALTGELEEDFGSVLRALSNWREEILNYFSTDYTNAFIEATNRTIRRDHEVGMQFKTLKTLAKFGIKERQRYREEGRKIPSEDLIRVPL
jgi:transposase